MKDVEEMTIKETAEELRTILLDYVPTKEGSFYRPSNIELRLEDLYYKFQDVSFIDVELRNFTAIIAFEDEVGDEYKITANPISTDFFDVLCSYGYDDYFIFLKSGDYRTRQSLINTRCVTFTLEQIQEELTDEVLQNVFKGHHVVSFKYLLANPRKDVVEWALEHKDELGISKRDMSEVAKYQVIPELKELILNSLNDKGE